jgi:SAGA-associated factor 73
MKIFGADPLKSTSEIGLVQCKDCAKPILRSAIAEHAGALVSFCSPIALLPTRVPLDNCKKYDLEKGGAKGKTDDGGCSRSQSFAR